MDENVTFRIETGAARALADWKAFFAEKVALEARGLARCSTPPGLITLAHYRQAAVLAAQALAIEVQRTESSDDRRKAA
ncbi:MAG: hypothetical protein JNL67_23400 [Planctomycetaceae bacterium]|nr:hypothetical protein [Planctomycetaceae bacterium]